MINTINTLGNSTIPVKLADFELATLDIIGHNGDVIDLTGIYTKIIVMEDMFTQSVNVDLFISDTSDMISTLPIIGQERVELKFKSPAASRYIYLQLWVYRVSNLKVERGELEYRLNLVTMDLVSNFEHKISRYFSNNSAAIALQIFEEFGSSKSLSISRSEDVQELVVPNISPFAAIRWLAKLAYKSGTSAYFFFENTKEYIFKPIEELFFNVKKAEYKIGPSDVSDIIASLPMIQEWKTISNFDVLANISKGMYKTTNLSCDILSRQVNKTTHSYWKDSERYIESRINDIDGADKPLMDISKSSKLSNLQHNPEIMVYTSSNKYRSYNTDENILSRYYGLQLFENLKIELKVYGNSSISAGDIIGIELPVFVESSSIKDVNASPTYYGKWLVVSNRHTITVDGYYMVIQAVKDRTAIILPKS
jgi:hypothetical protein